MLKFTSNATHEVNLISESQVADGSYTDGERGGMVMEIVMYYLLKEKVEQNGIELKTLTDAR
ncbi:hypothetical protein DPMN_163182 [Dreissena polymorpha]|uniref:Uncharacterized protein n=1 Tax=Dreissena polymorpha TaxID=45954 RepID=A0A9D4ETG4_DREPO|nr:hypothetical protein DPMN_163182 [Dreissena polymorpha]